MNPFNQQFSIIKASIVSCQIWIWPSEPRIIAIYVKSTQQGWDPWRLWSWSHIKDEVPGGYYPGHILGLRSLVSYQGWYSWWLWSWWHIRRFLEATILVTYFGWDPLRLLPGSHIEVKNFVGHDLGHILRLITLAPWSKSHIKVEIPRGHDPGHISRRRSMEAMILARY